MGGGVSSSLVVHEVNTKCEDGNCGLEVKSTKVRWLKIVLAKRAKPDPTIVHVISTTPLFDATLQFRIG